MAKKLIITLFVLILIAASALGGIYVYENYLSPKDVIVIENPDPTPEPSTILSDVIDEVQTVSIEEVQKILEPASELITAKYYYTEASTYENYQKALKKYKIPFTTDKTVFTYDGVISVGIELSEIEIDINNDDRIISIVLPPLEEKHNEIFNDSFDVPYEQNSPFTKTDMKNYTDLFDALQKAKSQEVMENKSFISHAKDSTINTLEAFLKTSSLTDEYELKFSWK